MRQDAGRIMPLPKGTYDENATYEILDMVAYDNKLWVCKKTGTTGVQPSKTTIDNWMMCVDGTTDISSLETELQTKIDGYDSKLEEISGNISTTNTSIQSMQTSIADLTESTNTVTTSVQSLDERCSTIENTVTEVQTAHNNVASTVSAQGNRITALENKTVDIKCDTIATQDSTNAITSGAAWDLTHAQTYIAGDYVSDADITVHNGGIELKTTQEIYNDGVSNGSNDSKFLISNDNAGYGIYYRCLQDPGQGSEYTYRTEVEIGQAYGKLHTIVYGRNNNSTITNQWFDFTPTKIGFLSNNTTDLGDAGTKLKNIYACAGTIQTSDAKYKKNIISITESAAKDLIMGLNPVTYKFIDGTSDRTHYGLIAQDVETAINNLGIDNKDFAGLTKTASIDDEGNVKDGEFEYGLRYDEFIAPLIKMCQNLQNEVTELRVEIETLKNK